SRRLASHKDDCTELASAVALAISIAIDPLQLSRPAPPPRVEPPPACPACPACPPERVCAAPPPCPACPPPPPPLPRALPPPSVEYRVSAGALLALKSEPAITGGGEVNLGLRWRRVSLALEGRFDAPRAVDLPGGSLGAHVLAAGLVPCVHHYLLSG